MNDEKVKGRKAFGLFFIRLLAKVNFWHFCYKGFAPTALCLKEFRKKSIHLFL